MRPFCIQDCCALIIAVLLFPLLSVGQNTVGLLTYDQAQTYKGYTLIYPHNQPNAYLLNNCGEIVHLWEDSLQFVPGNTAYLLEDGSLVKTKRNRSVGQDAIWGGGGGEYVEIRSWENDLMWEYRINNDSQRLHHDIEVLPNGNILMVLWDLKDSSTCIAAGRNPTLLSQREVWSETIIEVDTSTNDIVWKWEIWDHLIQQFDSTKANYGNVAEEPRKIDLNQTINNGSADWLHINSIDYNPDLDQIMVSCPYLNEMWVIDHSTSISEARTSLGGKSNHGGDFLYRIGNPAIHQQGDSRAQLLFFQHDAHWALDFLPFGHPDKGAMICFNNRVGSDFSTIEKWNAPWNMYAVDYELDNLKWGPDFFTETITHPNPQKIYSSGMSSAQILPNMNTLICSGRNGYLVELNPAGDVVWEYITPLVGGQAATQGDTLANGENPTFRADKYPLDYKPFLDKQLNGIGYIELIPDLAYCDSLTSITSLDEVHFNIHPNPALDVLCIEWNSGALIDVQILNIQGQLIQTAQLNNGRGWIDLSNLMQGTYFIKSHLGGTQKLVKL